MHSFKPLGFKFLTPRPAGVPRPTRPAGGGGKFCPPSLSPLLHKIEKNDERCSKALDKTKRNDKSFLCQVNNEVTRGQRLSHRLTIHDFRFPPIDSH